MIKKYFLIILIICFSMSFISASEITFSIEQKEYYFKIGQSAEINITMENTYDNSIVGIIDYSIFQKQDESGSNYIQINSQKSNMEIQKGESNSLLSLGLSDKELTIKLGIKFSYNNNRNELEVNIKDILIHFVKKQEDQQNEQNQQESSSEKSETQSNSQSKQAQSQTQQKSTNNQKPQDSSALKEQIRKELQDSQDTEKKFIENMQKNQELAKEHNELMKQGYESTAQSIDAESNDSGSFELNYEKEGGETASLKGEFKDGELKNIKKESSEEQKKLEEKIKQNEDFKELEKKIQSQGFNQSSINFEKQGKKTIAEFNYTDDKNQTVMISAEIEDDIVKNVKLHKNRNYSWVWIFLLIFIFLTMYHYNKKTKIGLSIAIESIPKKVFDYKKESRQLLKQAKKEFNTDKKEAYHLANRAIRIYLSYKNKLNKELTNYEILKIIKEKKLKQVFNLCDRVGFAKYEPNKTDFDKIISYAEYIIN